MPSLPHPTPCMPARQHPTPRMHHQQHPTTAARGKCSRLRYVQAESSGQFLPRLQPSTTTSPQQSGHAMQKPGKSSELCMILTEILQKWGHAVSIIGHKGNSIRPEMQETRHGLQGTPHFTSPVALFFPGRPIALPTPHAFGNSFQNPPQVSASNVICSQPSEINTDNWSRQVGLIASTWLFILVFPTSALAGAFFLPGCRGGRGCFPKLGRKNRNRIGGTPKK